MYNYLPLVTSTQLQELRKAYAYVSHYNRKVAMYWFGVDWNDGMFSVPYLMECSTQYNPGMSIKGIEDEDEEAYDAYRYYVAKHCGYYLSNDVTFIREWAK
jgi:hypothetical protein